MENDHVSDASASSSPGPAIQRLLFTDFEGQPADPDDVIADALEGGYRKRQDGVREVLRDPSADPYDRFLACFALTRWADPAGYEAVIEAARDPERVVWRGASVDRWFGADDTFAHLAEAVGRSDDMAAERGTGELRLEAARALVRIADRVQFERRLLWILDEASTAMFAEDLREVIGRALQRLASPEAPGFDLGTQTAGLIGALACVDEAEAVAFARQLIALNPGDRALRELADVVARGRGPKTLALRDELAALDVPRMEKALQEALRSRARRQEQRPQGG